MWWNKRPEIESTPGDPSSPEISIQAADGGEWDAYVLGHGAGTIYHTMSWRRLVEKTFSHSCPYLAARRGSSIVGILPLTYVRSRFFGRSLVSAAFADVGGICADDLIVARSLLEAAHVLGSQSGAAYLELRHIARLPVVCLQDRVTKVLPVLRLPGSERNLWDGFGAKLRNQIRKAQKSELEAAWGGTDLVRDFFEVYARNMRDLGTPVIAKTFFDNLAEIFAHDADILVLYKERLPVAGAVGLYFRNVFEVPWASSRRDFRHLSVNNMLYWEILRRSIEKGMDFFSFGRSTPDSGPYRFKEQWGPEPIPMHYQILPINGSQAVAPNPGEAKYRLPILLWKRLPLRMANRIGPWLARDLP